MTRAARCSRLRYEFDSKRFAIELEKAAVELGVSLAAVARETGVNPGIFSSMRNRDTDPAGPALAALCVWSGLNIADFTKCIDDEVEEPPPRTLQEAMATIRMLRGKLRERDA